MVADLNMPLEIVVCPTVRGEDGLALSSRNKYLSDAERKDALLISKALKACEKAISGGENRCRKADRPYEKYYQRRCSWISSI